jgi:Methyltransferase FkbM domain
VTAPHQSGELSAPLAADRNELEAALESQRQDLRRILKRLTHAELALEALLRRAYVDSEALPFPERLTAQRFRILSQNTEDGMVLAVFREAGIRTARFVEIGCGTNGGNSGFLARELGWSGVMIDASADAIARARLRFNAERVHLVEATVTRDNINELLRRHGIEGEIDLLSIDIDGNDYWVLDAIDVCSPRLLVCEYNAGFGPRRKVSVPYDEERVHERGSKYFGASLAALTSLARRRGYRLVAVEPRGANAFLLREDVAPSIPGWEPHQLFRPLMAAGLQTEDALSNKAVARLTGAEQRAAEEMEEHGLTVQEVE